MKKLRELLRNISQMEMLIKVSEMVNIQKNILKIVKSLRRFLNGSSFIPVNADNAEIIKQFETLNNLTINIYYLDKDAYDEKGKKKLHDLWSAKYITETNAKNMNPNNHLDFMLLRKIIKYELDPKTKKKLPIYKYHYVWLMDATELATDQEEKNLILYNV